MIKKAESQLSKQDVQIKVDRAILPLHINRSNRSPRRRKIAYMTTDDNFFSGVSILSSLFLSNKMRVRGDCGKAECYSRNCLKSFKDASLTA